jgi:hypothetical protein
MERQTPDEQQQQRRRQRGGADGRQVGSSLFVPDGVPKVKVVVKVEEFSALEIEKLGEDEKTGGSKVLSCMGFRD